MPETRMRIACLKHVEYEGPAYFPDWATRQGHVLEEFLVPRDGLPGVGDHDKIIVIGGPMSVWETDRHPWLDEEKRFLADILSAGNVQLEPRARTTWLGNALPNRFQSFFWHGDFFDLPGGAEPVASSEAHHVQGFVLGNCLGLQFHLEATPTWTRRLVKRDAHELVAGRFIQSAERICAATPQCYSENHRLLDRVMDRWLALDQKMKVRRPASSVIS